MNNGEHTLSFFSFSGHSECDQGIRDLRVFVLSTLSRSTISSVFPTAKRGQIPFHGIQCGSKTHANSTATTATTTAAAATATTTTQSDANSDSTWAEFKGKHMMDW